MASIIDLQTYRMEASSVVQTQVSAPVSANITRVGLYVGEYLTREWQSEDGAAAFGAAAAFAVDNGFCTLRDGRVAFGTGRLKLIA